jgi:Animal haem peroxidase
MPTATRIRDHCLAPGRSVDAPAAGGGYRRLFPELDPLDCEDDALHDLGRPGGVCDAAAAVALGAGAPDPDARGAAGWPVFGQFVAHDITADRSPLTHHAELAEIRNARSPRANLEVVYGDGPSGMPFLYDRDDPAKLLVGRNDAGAPADLPRNPQGVALVGDPRNDVHLLMSQLHVAMLHLHNGLVDRLRGDGVAEAELFASARRAATWHYQWVLLQDFLPRVIGPELAGELLAGGARHYRPVPGAAWIPLEFADAAYRYGHSQIGERYRVNRDAEPAPLFPDLLGFRPVPAALAVDWSCLFDLPARPPTQRGTTPAVSRTPPTQRAKRIDGRLAASLIQLPEAISGVGDDYGSLAVRDLQRGQGVGLPSGEAVARRLGAEPLTPEQVGLAAAGWRQETPLWFYLLKEAEHRGGGDRLGPVGGRLVGEVLVGIVDADGESYRAVDPAWVPTLPAGRAGRFGLADLLVFSGEVAAAAGRPAR